MSRFKKALTLVLVVSAYLVACSTSRHGSRVGGSRS